MDSNASVSNVLSHELSRRHLFKFAGAGVGVFGLSAILPGCSTGSSPSSGGGVFTGAFSSPIVNLDPHGPAGNEPATKLAGRQIFDTLVVNDNGSYKPSLATKWEQPEPTTWVFHLKQDVLFHDGTKLAPEDVAASLQRVIDLKGPLAPLWAAVTSIEPGDGTVTIKTATPLGTMLPNLTGLFIAPAAKVGEAEFFNKPVGSGPFKFESFVASDHLHLVANDKYWGDKALVQQVKLPYIPEVSSRVTGLVNGESLAMWTVPFDGLSQLKGRSEVKVEIEPSYVQFTSWFQCGRKPFNDPNVRRALWHAVDLTKLIDGIWGDTAELATGPIASTIFGFAKQPPHGYDPEKARGLLTQAGYPDGLQATLSWQAGVLPQVTQIAQGMISDWAKIGIKVKPDELQSADSVKKLLSLTGTCSCCRWEVTRMPTSPWVACTPAARSAWATPTPSSMSCSRPPRARWTRTSARTSTPRRARSCWSPLNLRGPT